MNNVAVSFYRIFLVIGVLSWLMTGPAVIAQSLPASPAAAAKKYSPAPSNAPVATASPAPPAATAPPKPAAAPPKQPDQLVAIINGVKVMRSDIERELRRNGRTLEDEEFTAEKRDRVLHDLISDIIVEQYLRDNNRLNDLELQDSLHYSKILSYSDYLIKVVSEKMKPIQDSEIQKFITEHFDYFEGRRAYDYVDIIIEKYPDLDMNKIQSFVDVLSKKPIGTKKDQQNAKIKNNSQDDFIGIINYVSGKKIYFVDFRGIKYSEEMDPATVAKLKTMQPGDTSLVNDPKDNFIHVIRLNNSTPNPVDSTRVRLNIIRGLFVEKTTAAVRNIIDQKREEVDIKIVNDLNADRFDKKNKIKDIAENVEEKVSKEYEKTKEIIKQMQEMASKKITAETARRKNKTTRFDARSEDNSSDKQSKINEWYVYATNIWILSLPVLFGAAFYQFYRQTGEKLKEFLNEGERFGDYTVERSFQRFVLSPLATWGIGAALFWILAQTAWSKFLENNIIISNYKVLQWFGTAVAASLALVFLLSKILKFFPQTVRNWRFLFLALIAVTHFAMLRFI